MTDTTKLLSTTNSSIIDELTDILTAVDPFCEKRFWESHEHTRNLPITNPVSAATGFVILCMAMFTSNIRQGDECQRMKRAPVIIFYLCRASLSMVGAGTMVFHSLDDTKTEYKDLNFRMCDWLPIVLMCTNIIVLYISKFEQYASECCLSIMFTTMYIWTCILILAVDSTTYTSLTLKWHDPKNSQSVYGTAMNVVLLAPLGITLATASFKHFTYTQSVRIWGCIALNLALWIGNAYGCSDNLWLSMFHAVYHVTIAYTFLYAACLGMTIDKKWKLDHIFYIWPIIEYAASVTQDTQTPAANEFLTCILPKMNTRPFRNPLTEIKIDTQKNE